MRGWQSRSRTRGWRRAASRPSATTAGRTRSSCSTAGSIRASSTGGGSRSSSCASGTTPMTRRACRSTTPRRRAWRWAISPASGIGGSCMWRGRRTTCSGRRGGTVSSPPRASAGSRRRSSAATSPCSPARRRRGCGPSRTNGRQRCSAPPTSVPSGSSRSAWQWGLAVPGDVSVVGFDDVDFAERFIPALTTIHQPREEIGRIGAERLVAALTQERPLHQGAEVIPTRFVVRASTAPR